MGRTATNRRTASPGSGASDRAESAGDVQLGHLSGSIGFHLRLAQDASFRAFARHAGQLDLKPGRFSAMMVIHNNPGISQAALGRALARDKSTVSPLIHDLRGLGLVERHPSATDRRSFTLTMTAAGETVLADLVRHAADHDRRLDAIVGDTKEEFILLLRKIADSAG